MHDPALLAQGITIDKLKKMEQIEVPINVLYGEITPNPKQPREVFDPASLNELKNAIIEFGQKSPIWITPFEDPNNSKVKYMIIAGERRWTAIGMIGMPRVKAIVFEGLSEAEILRLSIIENCCRDDLTLIEKIKVIRRLSQELGETPESIAKSFGWNAQNVEKYMKVGLNVDDSILKLLDEKLPDGKRLRFPAVQYLAGVKAEEHPALAEKLRGVTQPAKIRMIVSDHLVAADPKHSVHNAGHSFKSLKSTASKTNSELKFMAARTGETFERILKSRTYPDRARVVHDLQEISWLARFLARRIMGRDDIEMLEPKLEQVGNVGIPAPSTNDIVGLESKPVVESPQKSTPPKTATQPDNRSTVEQVLDDPNIARLLAMFKNKNPDGQKGHNLSAKERRSFSRAGKARKHFKK